MFTNTVNLPISVKRGSDLTARQEAFKRLGEVLERIPGFKPWSADPALPHDGEPDGWFAFQLGRKRYHLQFILLPNGYPKQVKLVMNELALNPRKRQTPDTYTVLVAPWFSPDTVKLAAEGDYGTLDLSGNYRLQFGSIFLERVGEAPAPSVRRQATSLFAPKSARILRALLAVPETDWKVSELATLTAVSQGLVSRVRTELLERGWASENRVGIRLADPHPLLRAWAEHHQATQGPPWSGYTLLHGARLNSALQEVMSEPDVDRDLLLAGPSAAQWLAPYLRDERHSFQVTREGFDRLSEALDLESEPTGNVVVRRTEDEGAFLDRIQVEPGYWLTSPVQTYLDLHLEGERGEEAAEHLFRTYLQPRLSGSLPTPGSPFRAQLATLRGQA